jgi:hypothetical protein
MLLLYLNSSYYIYAIASEIRSSYNWVKPMCEFSLQLAAWLDQVY